MTLEISEERAFDQEGEAKSYFIDLQWYEERGRSFSVLAQHRMCAACRSRLGSEVEELAPTVDERSGRVVFLPPKVPYGHDPLHTLRDCCGKRDDFIGPGMPLLEAIFRLFLANSNQPLTVQEVREQLIARCGFAPTHHKMTDEFLTRLLQNDRYYGLREFGVSPEPREDDLP